jgi:hypothetical protein
MLMVLTLLVDCAVPKPGGHLVDRPLNLLSNCRARVVHSRVTE